MSNQSGNLLTGLVESMSLADLDNDDAVGGKKHNEVLGNLGFRV